MTTTTQATQAAQTTQTCIAHRHTFYLSRTRTLRSGLVVYVGKCECGTEERITYTGRAVS